MNAARIPVSPMSVGRSWSALTASVVLHVAVALPLFLPSARPRAEITPPLAVELVLTAAPPAAVVAVPAPSLSTVPAPSSAPAPSPPPMAAPKPAAPSPLARAYSASRPVAAPRPVATEPAAPSPPAENATTTGGTTTGGTDNAAATAGTPGPATGGGATGMTGDVSSPGYALGTEQTPAPDYPWSARRRGVEGRVVLRLDVGADGRPTGVELVHGSGHDALDQAAITTVWQWRLRPAMAGGIAVAGRVVVPIVFKLT